MMRAAERADGPGGHDILHLLHGQDLGPDGADHGGEHANDDGNNDVVQRRAQDRHNGQDDDQARDGHHHVHDALHDEVHRSPGIRRDHPDDEPAGDPDQHGADPNVQGDTGAVDDAAEDIAPDMVGAQEIGVSRRHIHRDSIVRLADDLARIVRGEHRGQQSHHEQCQDDQTTHGSQRAALS